MKTKIFAFLLVVLMLVPMVVACGGNTDTTSQTNTQTNSNTSSTTPGSSDAPAQKVDVMSAASQEYAKSKWNGKTLDVLAPLWYGQGSKPEDAGTWSQPELYVKDYYDDSKYGMLVNDAVWKRQNFIKDNYGVEMKWYVTRSNGVTQSEMQSGLEAGYAKYHIAFPHMFEAQSLIGAETVYDLANSKYIDLTKSYYNQASVDSFSVYGHTFCAAGDFTFLANETAFVLFYNQAISETIATFPNLYNKVRNGEWTIAELAKWSKLKAVSGDTDGEVGYQDTDTYGFGSTSLGHFFQACGIQQVSVKTSSTGERSYYVSMNEDNAAVNSLLSQLGEIKSATWARTSWGGSGWDTLGTAFTQGRLLFYNEVVQKFRDFPEQNDNFKVGVLPMPMLNEDQDSYYAPLASQTSVMCIPKCTLDREMSEFFFELMASTGTSVMEAYYETLEGYLYDNGKTSREDALEMLTDYIFPGMCFDQGYMHNAMGQKFMSSVQEDSVGTDQYMTLYQEGFLYGDNKLNNDKTGWNTVAKNYKD